MRVRAFPEDQTRVCLRYMQCGRWCGSHEQGAWVPDSPRSQSLARKVARSHSPLPAEAAIRRLRWTPNRLRDLPSSLPRPTACWALLLLIYQVEHPYSIAVLTRSSLRHTEGSVGAFPDGVAYTHYAAETGCKRPYRSGPFESEMHMEGWKPGSVQPTSQTDHLKFAPHRFRNVSCGLVKSRLGDVSDIMPTLVNRSADREN